MVATSRVFIRFTVLSFLLLGPLVWTACSTANGKTEDRQPVALAISVSPVAATEQPIARFIRVTGTLTAEEQASVAAETAGRVVSTPVERGTRVNQGAELIRLSSIETDASVKEAEANAAQIEARLAQTSNGGSLRRRAECRKSATHAPTSRSPSRNSPGLRSCSPSASSRNRSTTSARRRWKPRASSSSRRKTAQSNSIRRCRRLARA